MKIKLDENLPARLARILSKLGHDADTVIQENLNGQVESWKECFVVITDHKIRIKRPANHLF